MPWSHSTIRPPFPAASKRTTADVTRSLIERTRGDITNTIRQQHLENALQELEKKVGGEGPLSPKTPVAKHPAAT